MAARMKLGRMYKRRDGVVVGPLIAAHADEQGGGYAYRAGNTDYTHNGNAIDPYTESPEDLVEMVEEMEERDEMHHRYAGMALKALLCRDDTDVSKVEQNVALACAYGRAMVEYVESGEMPVPSIDV